jgi:hypothetical protein
MRSAALGLVVAFAIGCHGADAAPPAASPATGAAAAAPPSDPPADPATLTVPGPAAAPCTNDSMCLNHRCNLPYGKCAFPCDTDADCVRGTFCFKAVISTCQARPPNQ